MKPRHPPVLVAAIVYFLVVTAPAEAYIDPGTGSLALQAMIGALAAAVFALRSQWSKITARLGRTRRGAQAPETPAAER